MDLRFYWVLFLRRLPVMMVFVLVCTGLAVITAMKLPETFSTSARLLVEAPQIPERMVASTVQTGAAEQLDILQQRLMTRANLIDTANRFRVFENLQGMDPDTVVEQMRAATTLRRSTGRDQRAMLLTIGFEARTPQIAAGVVNQYVTLVLDESTASRVGQAGRTLEFFEQEVQRLGEELDRQSAAIAAFRAENAEALPEDQSYRLNRQALLQERIGRLERDIAAAEAQRREIVRIFESTGQVRPTGDSRPTQRSPEEQQLAAARSALEQARSIYSEAHPEVVRLRTLIARLEAAVAAQTGAALPDAATEGTEAVSTEQAIFNATLAEIDTRLKLAREELSVTEGEQKQVQDAIARSSSNGIQLAALQREFESIQTRYNAAENNLNLARMSERVETTAQGQRISVIENASVPTQPVGPNRTKIIAMGLAAGLGLAGAWFVLLEVLNRTVRRPSELTSRFNVTPLAIIPYMESHGERLRRRIGLTAATLTVMVAVPLGLWYVDTHYLPLDLLVQKGLNRLGLG
jgi:uncharacterized protein involved in exopolysaccharide biosynthesis